jgi:hypothetical protein
MCASSGGERGAHRANVTHGFTDFTVSFRLTLPQSTQEVDEENHQHGFDDFSPERLKRRR